MDGWERCLPPHLPSTAAGAPLLSECVGGIGPTLGGADGSSGAGAAGPGGGTEGGLLLVEVMLYWLAGGRGRGGAVEAGGGDDSPVSSILGYCPSPTRRV